MPASKRRSDPTNIAKRIVAIRGQRVLLDMDLAELYGVPVKALNQAVRRNRKRFPPDFLIQATSDEWFSLRSQIVTLKTKRGVHRKYAPLAFTEQGALMAASVLNSTRAIEMSICVVRVFTKLRQLLASNAELVRQLEELEKSITTLDARTRKEFEEVYRAIRALMARPAAESRPIGFTADIGKGR